MPTVTGTVQVDGVTYTATASYTVTAPSKVWYLGMSTEPSLWAQRVSEVARPVNVRRRFRSTWSVSGLIALAEECHASGCLPYISAKMSPSTWAQVASGALDADAATLARGLVALGYPVRVTFHHEPRGSGISTPAQLVDWGRALTRLFTRMRAAVTPAEAKRLILGPTDNGFPWGNEWGGLSDAELGVYYTDTFLAACDVMGADFYDGVTDTNPGEPAWRKMVNFADYFDRRGFTPVNDPGWKYDAGEYQIYRGRDCDDLWTFLTGPDGRDFNCLSIFNSANNNRDDLPSDLDSWVLVPGTERMAAFRRMLDAAAVAPVL